MIRSILRLIPLDARKDIFSSLPFVCQYLSALGEDTAVVFYALDSVNLRKREGIKRPILVSCGQDYHFVVCLFATIFAFIPIDSIHEADLVCDSV